MTDNERTAYYRGRAATFNGLVDVKRPRVPAIFSTDGEKAQFKLGVRDACGELRLDADVEWDA